MSWMENQSMSRHKAKFQAHLEEKRKAGLAGDEDKQRAAREATGTRSTRSEGRPYAGMDAEDLELKILEHDVELAKKQRQGIMPENSEAESETSGALAEVLREAARKHKRKVWK
jgi:hypothetical protein